MKEALEFVALLPTRVRKVEAEASASDLASHHTWAEPSSTDVTQIGWRAKRLQERIKGRAKEAFEQ